MVKTQPPKPDRPKAANRRTKSSDVEQVLLDAANSLLVEHGPAGLTVRAVATQAGVAPMGVYNRFDGKHGLLEALYVQGFNDLRDRVNSASGPTAHARLRAAADEYRSFALDSPQHYRLMFEHVSEVEPSDQAVEQAYESFAALVNLVRACQDADQLLGDNEVSVAQQLWSAIHGAVSLELVGISFTEDPAQTYSDMVDALLVGLAPRR